MIPNMSEIVTAVPTMLSARALHRLLRADLSTQSFRNYLHRVMKSEGFPRPLRLGSRGALAWPENEIVAWLASRQRGGGFDGARVRRDPPDATA
jgi:predicted DNA-binding transcriptional regulator AlpA